MPAQKGFAGLLLLFFLLIGIGIAFYYFSVKKTLSDRTEVNPSASIQNVINTYSSDQLGIQFNYPINLAAGTETEEDYFKRNGGDARKNFSGYIQYPPADFIGAVYAAKDKDSVNKSPFVVWVFQNPQNLTPESWFNKYWYYPFMWGDFSYEGKQKNKPQVEATVSGKLTLSRVVTHQEGQPKYIYIPMDGKMYLIRVLTKDPAGDQILNSFKFIN